MVDRIGQNLGNYRLVQLLGRGGFAEVYLGEHRRLNTSAAIKILYTRVAGEEENDFLNEAQTIARLEHPHIVRILDFDVYEGLPFLVMQYATNGTLRQRHPRGTHLPFSTVIDYLTQITQALQYAHDEKIIHRDIKPENILLGRHNELLLSDFGIALIAQSSRLQSTQEVVGTAAYMAPEQLQGKPRFASDQYALGILVYEWLAGERPFRGGFVELYSQHLSVPPPPIYTKVPSLSLEIDQVLQTALAKDPTRRFGSVRAFATALQQAGQVQRTFPVDKALPVQPVIVPASQGSPLSQVTSDFSEIPPSRLPAEIEVPPILLSPEIASQPLPPSGLKIQTPLQQMETEHPGTELVRPVQIPIKKEIVGRRGISRRNLLIGGVGVLVLVGAGGVYAVSHQTSNRGNLERNLEGNLLLIYTRHVNTVESVAWSPDGKSIVSAGYDSIIHVWDGIGGVTHTYQKNIGWIGCVSWSPDGKRIASAGEDGTVQVWNATNGSASYTYTGHSSFVVTVGWSPDGKRIASAGEDGTVQVWNATNGSASYTYTGHSSPVTTVVWSPEGQRIASAGYDGIVRVWKATDESTLYIYTEHSASVNSVSWSPDGSRIASASDDETVQVWNAADGNAPYIYKGHKSLVNAVAWSPDGTRIASASNDRTVQVWNATDGSAPYVYQGHTNFVKAAAWSPDGKYIASAGSDKTVQVWQAT